MKYFAVAALAAAVQAAHLPTPANGQIGVLRFPITCQAFNGAFSIPIDGVYTATAPLTAQSGQQIYYTDVTAALTIPSYLTQLGSGIGTSYVNTKVFVDLALTNANPSTFTVFPEGLWVNNTKFQATGDTVVTVPKEGVLPDIGPVTVGAAGQIHNIDLGAISADIYLYNAQNALIFGPLTVTCPKQSPNILIGVVDILPQTDASPAPFAPKNGFVPDFPALGDNQEYGCFDFTYNCKFGTFSPLPFDVVACGGIQAFDPAGSKFYLENVTADLTVPSSAVGAIKGLYQGAASIDTQVEGFYVDATLTQPDPSSANGVPNGYAIKGSQLPASGDLVLTVPSSGVLRVGPYTAGTRVGELMYLKIGNTTAHITVRDNGGNDIGEADIVCLPETSNLALIGVTISSPTVGSGSTGGFGGFPGLGGGSSSSAAAGGFGSFPTSFPSFGM